MSLQDECHTTLPQGLVQNSSKLGCTSFLNSSCLCSQFCLILEIKFSPAKVYSLFSIRSHVIRAPTCYFDSLRQIDPKFSNDS